MIRVILPLHLRTLAKIDGELHVEADPPTIGTVLETIETRYPMLRGTIRDATTRQRRDFIRFFACQRDLSHQPTDAALPKEVISGAEPLIVVGAMAGG